MLAKIIAFAKGSVRVEVRGADVERYLSACAARGVELRDIERVNGESVRALVSLEGYFLMRKLCRRAMCSLRVIQKRGAPFAARRLEKRPGLLLGLALCVFAVWFLTGFVWTVEITGCRSVSELEIMQLLEKNGLKTGTRLSAVSPMQIKNNILLEIDTLSFLSVNLIGTHAQVVVRERASAPETVPLSEPCDVVSDKAGVIARLRVKQGAARVAVGQTLMPGDLIATGVMVGAQGDTWLVHAEAEADLRVWVNDTRILPASALLPVETGEQTVRRAIVIGNRRINLYMIESEPYAWYYKEVKKTPLTLSDGFRLPVTLITETYTELAPERADIDESAAAELLQNSMRNALESSHENAEIVSFRFEMREQDGAYVGRVQAECIETAGIEKLIK